MNVQLSPELLASMQNLVVAGRYQSVEEVVAVGLRMLFAQESLRAEIQKGIDDVDRGDFVDHETAFAALREKISRIAEG